MKANRKEQRLARAKMVELNITYVQALRLVREEFAAKKAEEQK